MMQGSANSASAARPWRPAPAIQLSLLLHVAGVALLLLQPLLWRWVLGGLVVNHLLLLAAVFWPRGRVLGSNLVRLPPAAGRLPPARRDETGDSLREDALDPGFHCVPAGPARPNPDADDPGVA